jgi:hypothetical protein
VRVASTRRWLSAVVLILSLAAASLAAQDGDQGFLLPVPAGANSWNIEIAHLAGFTGVARSRVALSSDGTLRCLPADRCSEPSPEWRQQVFDAVAALNASTTPIANADTFCRDCDATRVIVRRRSSSGRELIGMHSWPSRNGLDTVPAPVRQVYGLLNMMLK